MPGVGRRRLLYRGTDGSLSAMKPWEPAIWPIANDRMGKSLSRSTVMPGISVFDAKVALATELPSDRFKLFLPREIEIETHSIPNAADKVQLRDYIAPQVHEAEIATTYTLGFANIRGGPERCGGFGLGTFRSDEEISYYNAIRERYLIGKPGRGSGLSKNEGDAALGAASLGSVVLTCDLHKPGPILEAIKHHGGKVVDMSNFCASGVPLASLIEAAYAAP